MIEVIEHGTVRGVQIGRVAGAAVSKRFNEEKPPHRNRPFRGKVVSYSRPVPRRRKAPVDPFAFDPEAYDDDGDDGLFRVLYEDGDYEEYTLDELTPLVAAAKRRWQRALPSGRGAQTEARARDDDTSPAPLNGHAEALSGQQVHTGTQAAPVTSGEAGCERSWCFFFWGAVAGNSSSKVLFFCA